MLNQYFLITAFIFISWGTQIFAGDFCSSSFNVNNEKVKYKNNFQHFNYVLKNPKQKGHLKKGIIGNFNTLNPYGTFGKLPEDYLILVYDSLFFAPLDDINSFYPLIAKKICFADKKITIFLNENARWNNHQNITALDVIFTFNIAKEKSLPYYRSVFQHIKNINIINDSVLEINLHQVSKELLIALASIPIIYKDYWQEKDFKNILLESPISSGAYRIENINAGKSISFIKDKNYWAKDLPVRKGYFNFDKITLVFTKDNYSLEKLIKEKEVNFMLKDNYFKDLKKLGILQKDIAIKRIPEFKALFFNSQNKYLSNIDVRKALVLSYDFKDVNEKFFKGNYVRLNSLFLNTKFSFDRKFLFEDKSVEERLKIADNLLRQSGYKMFKGKRLDKEGKQISFNLVLQNKKNKVFYLGFIRNLTRLGIKVNLQEVSINQYNYLKKNFQYDMLDASYLFANPPSYELLSYFSSKEDYQGSFNYALLKNEKVDSLLQEIIVNKNKLKDLDKKIFDNYIFIALGYYPFDSYLHYDIFKWHKITDIGLDIFATSIK